MKVAYILKGSVVHTRGFQLYQRQNKRKIKTKQNKISEQLKENKLINIVWIIQVAAFSESIL